MNPLAGLLTASPAPGTTDSLKRLLTHTDGIAARVDLYLKVSKQFKGNCPDSVEFYWKKAQGLALSLRDEGPLANVYAQGGFDALERNQLDLANLNFTLAARYYHSLADRPAYLRMQSMVANICLVRDNVAGAMNIYMDIIPQAEELALNKMLPHLYNNVGNIYMDAGEYTNAISYYSKALEVFRSNGDTLGMAYPYLNMGESYYKLENLDLSADYTRQAIRIARQAGDSIVAARSMMILGMIQESRRDRPGAIAWMNRGIECLKSHSNRGLGPTNIGYTELLAHLGDLWYKTGDDSRALAYSRAGYSLARSMQQVRQVMNTALIISLIYENQKRFDSALFYHRIYSAQADSLSRIGTTRVVKIMEIKQEYIKKQKEDQLKIALEKSSRQTLIIIWISSGAGLLSVILILFLMLKLERQRKQQSETEKQVLKEKLDYQNKELTTNVMYLTRMNELVLMIAEKLKNLDLEPRSENARVVQSIVSELERTSNPDNWKEFEVRFQQVHVDFYRKLGEQFPDLTPNELKLSAFLRLNMSTKEISSITYQSQNSIMVARSRLRQKLAIGKDENLVIFLSQF